MKNGMEKAILDFPKQFLFKPKIVYRQKLARAEGALLVGMGGSHLAADTLLSIMPDLPLRIYHDYGLPKLLKREMVIVSSYSGNTEETIDSFHAARKRKAQLAVITTGGALLELAREHEVPHIVIPNSGIQPRMALGFGAMAILTLLEKRTAMNELRLLSRLLHSAFLHEKGKELAKMLKGKVPVIYASERNRALALNWKIKCNETGKIPAFWNVVPELNHNEMTGFDAKGETKHLANVFSFLFLKDNMDHPKVIRRMAVMRELFKKRGLAITELTLSQKKVTGRPLLSRAYSVYSSLLIADWFALQIAKHYGLESEAVPMVEEFKKLIMRA